MTRLLAIALLAAFAAPAFAASAGTYTPQLVMLGPVPFDFILFACVLLGIALFHHYTFQVAVSGLVVIGLCHHRLQRPRVGYRHHGSLSKRGAGFP